MIPFPNKKYQIIYADPHGHIPLGKMVIDLFSVKDSYPVMSTEDIKALPVKDIADDNCICIYVGYSPSHQGRDWMLLRLGDFNIKHLLLLGESKIRNSLPSLWDEEAGQELMLKYAYCYQRGKAKKSGECISKRQVIISPPRKEERDILKAR